MRCIIVSVWIPFLLHSGWSPAWELGMLKIGGGASLLSGGVIYKVLMELELS
jgi:hypothetical protein